MGNPSGSIACSENSPKSASMSLLFSETLFLPVVLGVILALDSSSILCLNALKSASMSILELSINTQMRSWAYSGSMCMRGSLKVVKKSLKISSKRNQCACNIYINVLINWWKRRHFCILKWWGSTTFVNCWENAIFQPSARQHKIVRT